MKTYFVILVNVNYSMKTLDWVGSVDGKTSFSEYPTDGMIESAMRKILEDSYPTDEKPTVYHARVEKRYSRSEC